MPSATQSFASVEHHGVQPTGCMVNEPESSSDVPYEGLPCKTDLFWLDPTQTCATERRCVRVSSVYPPRTLKVTSRTKVFPVRPTYSGSTLLRPALLEGGVLECHQCIHLAHWKCCIISGHANSPSWFCPACLPTATFIPARTQLSIVTTNYTHVPTMIDSSAFHAQL